MAQPKIILHRQVTYGIPGDPTAKTNRVVVQATQIVDNPLGVEGQVSTSMHIISELSSSGWGDSDVIEDVRKQYPACDVQWQEALEVDQPIQV